MLGQSKWFFIAMALWLSACKSPSSSIEDPAALSTGPLSSDPSVAAFQQSVFPIVREYCVQCHLSSNSPFFAADDATLAHNALIDTGKIDFANPSRSRLVERLRLNLHNCWSDCSANADEMQAAIEKWAANRGAGAASVLNFVTEEQLIPVEAVNSLRTMSYDVSEFFDPPQPGWLLEINVQKYDDFSIQVSNPRVRSPAGGGLLYIKNMNVLIDGSNQAQNATYRGIDQVFSVAPGGTSLSSASMIMPFNRGPGFDSLSIAFEAFSEGSDAGLAAARFAAFKNVIQSNCIGCHSGTPGRPNFSNLNTEADWQAATFDFDGDMVEDPLLLAGDSANSLIYLAVKSSTFAPLPNITPMPPGNTDQAYKDSLALTIKNWIDGL